MNPSERIDNQIASLGDWRGKTLSAIRKIVHQADPEVTEEWKWMGTPTWSHSGIVCIANAHKKMVQMVFAQGASLPDPEKLFNAMLEGNRWRAIKFFEGDPINVPALKNLIHAALALNLARSKGSTARGPQRTAGKRRSNKGSRKQRPTSKER
jgi:hypothetical protein